MGPTVIIDGVGELFINLRFNECFSDFGVEKKYFI
jgi:hypothetical protein